MCSCSSCKCLKPETSANNPQVCQDNPLGTDRSELMDPKYTVPGQRVSSIRKKFNTTTPEDHFFRKDSHMKFTASGQHFELPPPQPDPDEKVSNRPMDSHQARDVKQALIGGNPHVFLFLSFSYIYVLSCFPFFLNFISQQDVVK